MKRDIFIAKVGELYVSEIEGPRMWVGDSNENVLLDIESIELTTHIDQALRMVANNAGILKKTIGSIEFLKETRTVEHISYENIERIDSESE